MILVIFDIDGTLVHSKDHLDSKAFAKAYEDQHAKSFPTIDWRKYPHVTDTVIYQTVFKEHFQRLPEEQERVSFEAKYIDILWDNRNEKPDHFLEIPGARSMVEHLQETNGFRVAVATGGWKLPQQVKLAHVGFQLKEVPFSGADGKHTREAILEEAVELSMESGIQFERIVYVGDAIWDVITTRNMKMNFIGVRHRKDFHVLEQIGAQYVLDNYTEQQRFLDYLQKAETPLTIE